MTATTISVVITTLNAEDYISDCLQSLINQTRQPDEIIIVDGGSSDSTIDIINDIASSHGNIHLYLQKGAGIYAGLNGGINESNGNWLIFLGADDTLHDTDVLIDVESKLKNDIDLVYGDSRFSDGRIISHKDFSLTTLQRKMINHQAIFFQRKLFSELGLYNEKYLHGGDYIFLMKVLASAKYSSHYTSRLICNYNVSGSSGISLDREFCRDFPKLFEELFGYKLSLYHQIIWKYLELKPAWFRPSLWFGYLFGKCK